MAFPRCPWSSCCPYVAAYLLIGACIFGPAGKLPSLRQAIVFLLPGALLVEVAFLDLGFWCGGWLLGLPAWGLLLSRWTPGNPLPVGQVLRFLGLLVLGMAIFTFNIILVVFSLTVFLSVATDAPYGRPHGIVTTFLPHLRGQVTTVLDADERARMVLP